mmetsp:Transcript_1581/g.5079  ORF Transcript_1581/g.5079 Transcript_1581/m.5079 type:complete len:515 (+) Transcript_1581:1110-2654(+)
MHVGVKIVHDHVSGVAKVVLVRWVRRPGRVVQLLAPVVCAKVLRAGVRHPLSVHHALLPHHEVLVDVGVVGEEEGGVRWRGRHVANLAQRLVVCRGVQGEHLLELPLRARLLVSRAVHAFEGAEHVLLLAVLPLDPVARVVGVGARVKVVLRVAEEGVLVRAPVSIKLVFVVFFNLANAASVRVAGDVRGARRCVERRPAHVDVDEVVRLVALARRVVALLQHLAAAHAVLVQIAIELFQLAQVTHNWAPGREPLAVHALVGHVAVLRLRVLPVLVVEVAVSMQLPIRPAASALDFKVWAGPELLAEVRVRPDVLLRVALPWGVAHFEVRHFRVIEFRAEIGRTRSARGAVVLPRRDVHSPVEVEDGRAVQRHVPPGDRADGRVDGEDRHLEGPHERLVEQHEARRAVALVAARVRCCARVQIDEIGEGPRCVAVARTQLPGRFVVHDVDRARELVDLSIAHLAPLLPLTGFRQAGVHLGDCCPGLPGRVHDIARAGVSAVRLCPACMVGVRHR